MRTHTYSMVQIIVQVHYSLKIEIKKIDYTRRKFEKFNLLLTLCVTNLSASINHNHVLLNFPFISSFILNYE